MNINDTIFGNLKDLNTRRDNFRALLEASFEDESLLWKSREEYAAILGSAPNVVVGAPSHG